MNKTKRHLGKVLCFKSCDKKFVPNEVTIFYVLS